MPNISKNILGSMRKIKEAKNCSAPQKEKLVKCTEDETYREKSKKSTTFHWKM